MKIFRGMKVEGGTKIIEGLTPNEINSYSVLLSRYNSYEGKEAGKYIHAGQDNKKGIIELVCVSYETYLLEKKGSINKYYWKQFLTFLKS